MTSISGQGAFLFLYLQTGAADRGQYRQAAGSVARRQMVNPMNRFGSTYDGAYETFARASHIQHQSRGQTRPKKQ
jgi:hypothetical protein